VSTGRGQGGGTIQLPPFADLDFPLGRLWRKRFEPAKMAAGVATSVANVCGSNRFRILTTK